MTDNTSSIRRKHYLNKKCVKKMIYRKNNKKYSRTESCMPLC